MERGEETLKKSQKTTATEAKKNEAYFQALIDLLYQLADDDFMNSFRGSEWLGLAPHIEEDVAFSSITQNTMGHAVLFYQLLEELGEGDRDVLAHVREANARRNAVYLEKRNGEGSYLVDPQFDWALTVVRQYLYEVFKKVKLEALTSSSYQPLAHVADRVLMEQSYHLAHWQTWFRQLQKSTEDAKRRLNDRLQEAWGAFDDVLSLGPYADEMEAFELVVGEEELKERWMKEIKRVIKEIPKEPLKSGAGRGRYGEHTEDLDQALVTLSEVYNSDRTAAW